MACQKALIDTLYSDTATIAVMEITAIRIDLWLAVSATLNQALFWNSLLLLGLAPRIQLMYCLVRLCVKGGMRDPRNTTGSHQH